MSPTTTDDTTMPAEPVRSDLAIRLEEMELERAKGTTPERPAVLPIAALVLDDAFRLRIGDLDEYLLTELGLALKSRDDLDPVLVMPCGSSFYLVDGRHRLEAYQRAKLKTIPVRYFQGEPKDARAEAIRIGCKVSRPLSNSERMSLAWQNHLSGAYSLRAIAKMCGVSKSSLDIMARAKRDLADDAFGFSEWWRALQAWKGDGELEEKLTDEQWASLEEQRGRQHAERLRKSFGDTLRRNSNAAAHALGMYFGHKLGEVIERLHQLEYVQQDDEEDGGGMF